MYRVVAAEWRMKWLMSRCACGAMRASGWRRGDTAQGSAIFWATAASFALRRPYFLVWPSICRPYRLPLGIRPARVSSLRAELSQHLQMGRQQRRADELSREVSSWWRRMKRKRTWAITNNLTVFYRCHQLLKIRESRKIIIVQYHITFSFKQRNVIGLQMVVMST